MAQHLDPFGFTTEDQPKYETGQNPDEDGPQSKEIPFPTLDTDEDGNGPQNEDFGNVPMPSACDERLLDEVLDQQRDEAEADNLMFDEFDDAAQQEAEHAQMMENYGDENDPAQLASLGAAARALGQPEPEGLEEWRKKWEGMGKSQNTSYLPK